MDEGAKSRFERAADVLGVDPAIRETMWRRIGDLQLSPDDPTVVFLAVAGILEKAAIDIPAAISSFPQKIQDGAKEAVKPLTDAAVAAGLRVCIASRPGNAAQPDHPYALSSRFDLL